MRVIKLIILIYLLTVQALCVPLVLADFTFSTPQTTLDVDAELEITVNLSVQGQNNVTYYLEGAFKKETGSTYFGLTWNGTNFVPYSSSEFNNLKLITTDSSGNWSGVLKVKLDKDSSQFIGSGNYILKIKRFTTGGSNFWSDNEITLAVTSSTPTSTPTPTAPSNTPTPSKTPTPAKTPTPQPTTVNTTTSPQPTSTPKPSLTLSPKKSPTPTVVISQEILGLTNLSPTPEITPFPTPEVQVKSLSFQNITLFSTGILIILVSILSSTFIFKRNGSKI